MSKIDLKKELKHLYSASAKTVAEVDVPPMNFLMIDGSGHPRESEQFPQAMEALYGLAYTIKFILKKIEMDSTVMPVEAVWWSELGPFDVDKPQDWRWTAMIMEPPLIDADLVKTASRQLEKRKNPVALAKIRFEEFSEGTALQILHIGPYSEERPTIAKLHAFAKDKGYKLTGRHREIYLSDPGRAAADKLKTIIRQPIKR